LTRSLRVTCGDGHDAITFCKDNHLPLRVFDLMAEGNLGAALDGVPVGTLVSNGKRTRRTGDGGHARAYGPCPRARQGRIRLGTHRTASSSLIENLIVDYYGTETAFGPSPTSRPEPRLLVVSPLTRGYGRHREGHHQRGPWSHPSNDGNVIRLASASPRSVVSRSSSSSGPRPKTARSRFAGATPRAPELENLEKDKNLSSDDIEYLEKVLDKMTRTKWRRLTRCSLTRSRNFLKSKRIFGLDEPTGEFPVVSTTDSRVTITGAEKAADVVPDAPRSIPRPCYHTGLTHRLDKCHRRGA